MITDITNHNAIVPVNPKPEYPALIDRDRLQATMVHYSAAIDTVPRYYCGGGSGHS